MANAAPGPAWQGVVVARRGQAILRHRGGGCRVRGVVVYGGAVALAVWTLLPLYWLVFLSLTPRLVLLRNPLPLVPVSPTAANFAWFFEAGSGQADLVRRGFANSLLVAALVTALTLAIAAPAAYALSRRRFGGAAALLFAVLVGRAYPPVALAVPFFWLYARHGLLGTYHGLVIAYIGTTLPLVVWMLVGVFAGLPPAVLAAARVDGNTPWQVFRSVAVPLARPGIGAAAVVAFVGCWNEFTLAQFLAAGSPAQTFPPAVAPLLAAMPNELAAASLVGIAPAVALVVAFRRLLQGLALIGPT